MLGHTRMIYTPRKKNTQQQHIASLGQVAEMGSHSDVQRTVDDDLTSSACLHYSDNNKSFCLGLCLFIITLINILRSQLR